MSVGWGIIGTGRQADLALAPAISTLGAAGRLVGVVSRDAGRAEDFARRHESSHAYTRYEELLANPEVDVVLIAMPNALHAEHAIAAARAGKHVFCDKPLATNVDDAARVLEACVAAGVRLGLNFQVRHLAATAEARRVIASGEIGEVIAVQAEYSTGRTEFRDWRRDPGMAGLGSVNNLAVHTYDLVRYLLGSEVAEVLAMFDTTRPGELERMALTLFRFETGPLVYVNANQAVPFTLNDYVVYGTAGTVVGHNLTRHMQDGELRVITAAGERVTPYSTADAYRRSVADMNAAIVEGREPLAAGIDGLRSVELTAAVADAARHGSLVRPHYRALPA